MIAEVAITAETAETPRDNLLEARVSGWSMSHQERANNHIVDPSEAGRKGGKSS